MKSVLSDLQFHDEAAAYRFVEERVWPNGPVSPLWRLRPHFTDERQKHPHRYLQMLPVPEALHR